MKNTKKYNLALGEAIEKLEGLIVETKGLSIGIGYLRKKDLWTLRFHNHFVWRNKEDRLGHYFEYLVNRINKEYGSYVGLAFEKTLLLDAVNEAINYIENKRSLIKDHTTHQNYTLDNVHIQENPNEQKEIK
jgi:hypothetical protein